MLTPPLHEPNPKSFIVRTRDLSEMRQKKEIGYCAWVVRWKYPYIPFKRFHHVYFLFYFFWPPISIYILSDRNCAVILVIGRRQLSHERLSPLIFCMENCNDVLSARVFIETQLNEWAIFNFFLSHFLNEGRIDFSFLLVGWIQRIKWKKYGK